MPPKATKRRRTRKTQVETVKRLVQPDPLDEIASQVKEWVDRVLELRTLAPVLADANKLAAETESRIRVLQQEIRDLQNGLLPGMPAEQARQVPRAPEDTPESTPEPPRGLQGIGDSEFAMPEYEDDGNPTAETYNMPLRYRTELLSTKTIASCNNAGLITVGKIVEWWASRTPFSSIEGIGAEGDQELRALVLPFRAMLPSIRATLGM